MAIRTYDILLDSYNSTMPEPIVGRQGDKNGAVTLNVTLSDRGNPIYLSGQTINLMAETANGTAIIADNGGVTITDATNGKFTYAVPNALWSEAGKIKKAYFSLIDNKGQQTTYDLIFIVKKAIDISQDKADDYVTIIDGTLRDLKTKIDTIHEEYQNGSFYSRSEMDSILDGLNNVFYKQDVVDTINHSTQKEAAGYANMRRLGQMYNSPGDAGSRAQGFTALNSETAIQYFQNTSGFDQQQGVLKKFNVKTGVISLTNTIKGYHGNSLSYNSDDGFVYMAMSEDTSGVDTSQKTHILKINPDDLSISENIDLTSKTTLSIIHCVGYDNVNKLFVVGDNNKVEFYDTSWKLSFKASLSNVLGYTPGFMQGAQVNGNILYWIGGRKSQIWMFEINAVDHKLDFKTQYSFDNFQENLYPTGEIQGIGFNGDEVYIASNVSISGWAGLSEYFITTAKFKIATSSPSLIPYVFANAKSVDFYVGDNNSYNPDGTKSNPFASLLEAETCMMSTDISAKSLTLLNTKTEVLILASLNNVTFNGNGNKVRAVVVSDCKELSLEKAETSSYSGYSNCGMYIYNSNVTLNDYKIASLNGQVDYELVIQQSVVRLTNADNTSRIHTRDSTLLFAEPTKLITKDDDLGLVLGDFHIGSFTDISNPSGINMSTMLHYYRVKAIASVKADGKTLGFRLETTINKSVAVANLSGYTISSNVLYFIMIHYVRDKPEKSTIQVFKLPDFKSVSVSTYNIDMYLTDN